MRFYDVKAKKSFETDKYTTKILTVKGRKKKYAVTKSPLTGIEVWRSL